MMIMHNNAIIKTTSATTMWIAWVGAFSGALFVHTVNDYYLVEDTISLKVRISETANK